jgi:hypothetical protein
VFDWPGGDFSHRALRERVAVLGTFGVLRPTLKHGGYTWDFIPASGAFRDTGRGACH